MYKFNKRVKTILEDIVSAGDAAGTATVAFGDNQGHPAQIGKSGDFYAPGDNRNIWGTKTAKKAKKSKFKAPGFKKSKIIRRTPAPM